MKSVQDVVDELNVWLFTVGLTYCGRKVLSLDVDEDGIYIRVEYGEDGLALVWGSVIPLHELNFADFEGMKK